MTEKEILQEKSEKEVKKGQSSTDKPQIGVCIGLTIAVLVVLGFYGYSSYRSNGGESDVVQQLGFDKLDSITSIPDSMNQIEDAVNAVSDESTTEVEESTEAKVDEEAARRENAYITMTADVFVPPLFEKENSGYLEVAFKDMYPSDSNVTVNETEDSIQVSTEIITKSDSSFFCYSKNIDTISNLVSEFESSFGKGYPYPNDAKVIAYLDNTSDTRAHCYMKDSNYFYSFHCSIYDIQMYRDDLCDIFEYAKINREMASTEEETETEVVNEEVSVEVVE